MASILVAYYSRTGNTAQLADHIAQGAAAVAGAEVHSRPVAELKPEDLLEFDAIILGSPVYYGTMAAEVKRLLDDTIGFHGRLAGKVGAAFATCGVFGGGVETTVLALLQAMLVHGMVIQGDAHGPHFGAVAVGAPDEKAAQEGEKLGRRTAALARQICGELPPA
ncbi:MAG TPA: flavodoxin family protein [Armatimonadota bacterium]|jgi:NAD(P)H dehydrogenase (quinone)